jgi:hypothetical protein
MLIRAYEMCVTFFQSLIPIDQFHQSEQLLTLIQHLVTTDASSIKCIDLCFLKLNIGDEYVQR